MTEKTLRMTGEAKCSFRMTMRRVPWLEAYSFLAGKRRTLFDLHLGQTLS
jgi:hypothetical protein